MQEGHARKQPILRIMQKSIPDKLGLFPIVPNFP
jgi:hypothetical protein